jgi:multidrug resistance protein, MATE family
MNFSLKNYSKYYRSLFTVGIPIIIGQIGMIVLGFADTLMIGHHSTTELAAASFVNNVFTLAIIFAMGFSYGLTPIVGDLYGKGEVKEVGSSLKNSLFANTLIALLLTFIMWIVYISLDKMGQPKELIPIIRPYYIILLISIVFVMLFNGFKQFADGITDTNVSMWILIGGNALNIFGNYILIYGKFGAPEMGLVGAGLSTLISRIVMVIVFAIVFFKAKKYHCYREGFKESTINKREFIRLNCFGWPIALQMGMETASFSLSTIMVGWIGTMALAAHQIMLTVSQLCFMIYYGMGAAVAIRVSNFKGQNDIDSVKHTSSAGFHIIMVLSITSCLPIFILRNELGALFTDNLEVGLLVAQLVIPMLIYQFGDGLQCNYANALRGIADVKPIMLYAFIAYFLISLPVGYFFAFILNWGLVGIWMAFPFGLTSAGIMYYLRFKLSVRKL